MMAYQERNEQSSTGTEDSALPVLSPTLLQNHVELWRPLEGGLDHCSTGDAKHTETCSPGMQ
jgi:hypothetical protein